MGKHLTPKKREKMVSLKMKQLKKAYDHPQGYEEQEAEILYNPDTRKFHIKIIVKGLRGGYTNHIKEFTLGLFDNIPPIRTLWYKI